MGKSDNSSANQSRRLLTRRSGRDLCKYGSSKRAPGDGRPEQCRNGPLRCPPHAVIRFVCRQGAAQSQRDERDPGAVGQDESHLFGDRARSGERRRRTSACARQLPGRVRVQYHVRDNGRWHQTEFLHHDDVRIHRDLLRPFQVSGGTFFNEY